MGEFVAHNISQSRHYCRWLARLCARSGSIIFHEAALLWLAGMVTDEVGPITFHGISIIVDGWHGYGRVRCPYHFTEPGLLWLAGTVMGEVAPITFYEASITVIGKVMGEVRSITFHGASITVVGCHGYGRGRGSLHFAEPGLLWLAGTVMGEVGAHNISWSVTVIGWHVYGIGRGP